MIRQHPIVIFTGIIKELKGYIFPVFLVFIASFFGEQVPLFENRWFLFIALFSIGASILAGILKWVFYTYHYDTDAIIIKSGVFVKKHRHIKKERIQTIHLEAGILLRTFKMTSVHVETAGNLGESEVAIGALPKSEAIKLKTLLLEDKTFHGTDDTALKQSIEIDMMTLLKAGLTSGSVIVVMLFILVISFQIIAFLPASATGFFSSTYERIGILFIIGIVLFLLISAWLISTLRYAIRYALFTIKRQNGELEISRGLFMQKTINVKLHRVQSVIITQGVFRQPFNYVSIEVKVAGGRTNDNVLSTIIHPLIKKHDVNSFLDYALPGYLLEEDLQHIPKRARIRYLIRATLPFIMFAPFLLISPYIALIFVLLPLVWVLAYHQHKTASYQIIDDILHLRTRTIAKTWVITKKKHIQALAFRRSPFQRLKRVSTAFIHVLAAPQAVTFSLRDIGIEDQDKLYAWLSKSVG